MNYNEFKKYVTANIKDYLPSTFAVAEVMIIPVHKADISYDGLVVKLPDKRTVPTVNLNICFEGLRDIEERMRQIAEVLQYEPSAEIENLDLSFYKGIKDKLFIRLSPAKKDFLKDVPHKRIEDLAVTCHCLIEKGPKEVKSVAINNDILEQCGIDFDTLFEDALESSQNVFPVSVFDLGSMFGIAGSSGTVISNVDSYCGAAAMLYPNVLDSVACGEALYILPSSVHEVFVLEGGSMNVEDLANLVKTVNGSSAVDEETFLSNHVYKYENGKISIAF